ncbi:shikimate dehydrogenase substrate binding domain-containing protein [Astrocystis sublimbata]|nr:shikimate dehydrogenase substrate binding domain-containing protein [Astrocystis sublimbata]
MSLPIDVVDASSMASSKASFEPATSIVLVGIRGSGKSTLAIIASTAMKRRVIDLEKSFQDVTGLSTVAYKKRHGPIEYRRQQQEVLGTVLAAHQRDCIIVLSWMEPGIHALLQEYATSHPVVHVTRDPEAIQEYLKVADDYKLRELMSYAETAFRVVANFEFFNVSEQCSRPRSLTSGETPGAALRGDGPASPAPYLTLKRAERHFLKFLSLIMPPGSIPFIESAFPLASTPTETRQFTYAVSVPLSRVLADKWETEDIETGADAIEIVIDDDLAKPMAEFFIDQPQLSSDRASEISKAVGALRRNVVIPMIYHVPWPRSESVDGLLKASYLEHVQHGLLLCPEYITVDLRLDEVSFRRLLERRRFSKIIGVINFECPPPPLPWSDPTWMGYYRKAQAYSCDLVKMTRPATFLDDNFEINMLRCSVSNAGEPVIPLVAYNTGVRGRHSACLNKILTSTLPESLFKSTSHIGKRKSSSYIEPSITPRQATIALRSSFATDNALKLYVVGANCQHSLSPAMHNTAIEALGTSHIYKPYSTNSLSSIRDLIHDPSFAGASVGLPFKVEVISLTHSLSTHAKAIGAVNTLIPIRRLNDDRSIPDDALLSHARKCAGPVLALYGENTDWIGIRACIRRGLSPANAVRDNTAGLVIGAGGMARAAVYSMLQLGVQNIAVHNRSPENAQKLVSHFELLLSRDDIPLLSKVDNQKTNFHILRSREDAWPEHLRQPTIVVSCIPAQKTGDQPPPDFTLPESWMGSPTGGVVVDFSYQVINTPLILQTRAEAHRGWIVMDSLDLLPEQGFAQFELFTGRRAPRRLMRAEVLKSIPDEQRSYPLQPRLDSILEQEP